MFLTENIIVINIDIVWDTLPVVQDYKKVRGGGTSIRTRGDAGHEEKSF